MNKKIVVFKCLLLSIHVKVKRNGLRHGLLSKFFETKNVFLIKITKISVQLFI